MTVASASDTTTTERPHAGADARSLQTAARAAAVAPPRWAATYVQRLVYTDAAAIVIAVTVAQLVRFGSTDAVLHSASSELSYTAVSVLLALGWIVALALFHTRDARVVGTGADEYRRVAHASLALFGSVAIVAFLGNQDLARGYIAVALPAGLTTLGGGRWLWRRWLLRRRMSGHCTSTVLVVGSHRAALAMAKTFESDVAAGYRVVGVCVPGTSRPQGELLNVDGHAVPVLGDQHAVLQALEFTGADTVAVSNTDSLGTDGMRALAWELDAVDVDMVVSAGVVDVAGANVMTLQSLGGIKEVQVRRNTAYFLDRFTEARQVQTRARAAAAFLGELPRYVVELLFILAVVLATLLSLITSDSSGQSLSAVGLFVAAGFRLLPSVVRVSASVNSVRVGQPSRQARCRRPRRSSAAPAARGGRTCRSGALGP